MIRLALLLVLLAGAAQAQSVSVRSGEHGPFTRLVLTFPSPINWVVGRTQGGYAVRVDNAKLPYDLSGVYDLITKDRLRSVWVDPTSGDFQMGIECTCHVIPFELNPRTIVIDIKDGAPPPNSSFELSLADGSVAPPITAKLPPRPRLRSARAGGYDWLANSLAPSTPPATSGPAIRTPAFAFPEAPEPLETDLRLEAFRSMLVEEVGRGASSGVVQMTVPDNAPPPAETRPSTADPDNARAALESLPGIEILTKAQPDRNLTVDGDHCPSSQHVDVSAWSETDDASKELSAARSALLSEFDVPNSDNVLRAVNTHLYFGFGAEARSLMESFLPPGEEDPLRLGISYIVDGEAPPDNPFAKMQSCDSAAALWALLAADPDLETDFINGAAVSRTFLALPSHLRGLLGPETSSRLLRFGDTANAEVVRSAFGRAVAPDDPAIAQLAADQALQTGAPAAAEAMLPNSDRQEEAIIALLSLVEARFQQRKSMDGKDLLTLQAYAFEIGSGVMKPRLDRALVHASALAGDFGAAFSFADANPTLTRDVWLILAEMGTDTQIMTYAVGLAPEQRMALPGSVQTTIADRLAEAGLPNAARDWATSPEVAPELAARIALENGDARTGLRLLSRPDVDVDPRLVATSYTALGEYAQAAQSYRDAGDEEAANRLLRWTGATPPTADETADPWATVADMAGPTEDASLPPLQAGQSKLEQSATTRQAIADLLATTGVDAAPATP